MFALNLLKRPPLELPNGHFIKLGTGLESEECAIITPILVGNTDLFT